MNLLPGLGLLSVIMLSKHSTKMDDNITILQQPVAFSWGPGDSFLTVQVCGTAGLRGGWKTVLPPPINKKTFAFMQSQNPKRHTGDLLPTGVYIMEKRVVPFILLHHSRRTSSRMQDSEIQNTLRKVPMYVLRSFQVLIRSSNLMRTIQMMNIQYSCTH